MQTTRARERKVGVNMLVTKEIPEDCGKCEFFKPCTYNLDGRCFWVEYRHYLKEGKGTKTVIIIGDYSSHDVAWIKNLFLT